MKYSADWQIEGSESSNSTQPLNLLVFSEHFARSESHNSATNSSEHAELEPGEGDGGSPQAGGHEEGGGDGHLTVVCLQGDILRWC